MAAVAAARRQCPLWRCHYICSGQPSPPTASKLRTSQASALRLRETTEVMRVR